MSVMKGLLKRIRRFALADDGGITIFALFIFMAMFVIVGLAIDTSRLQARTTMLQNTADSAAYTAAQRRIFNSASVATAAAVATAQANMSPATYGNVVTTSSVEWGTWNTATRTFTPDPTGAASGAVRVTARQSRANGNPFYNILLGWIGVGVAEPSRVAVAMNASDRGCLREGFISQQQLTINSNNVFMPGFCLHSNTGVTIQNNGTFNRGVTVSMPNIANVRDGGNLDIPPAALDSNVGLRDALVADQYELYTLTQMERIIDSFRNSPSSSPFLPSHITDRTNVYRLGGANGIRNNQTISSSDLQPGKIYVAECPGGDTSTTNLTIDAERNGTGGTVRQVVLITNCQVKFGSGSGWEDSILASTNRTSAAVGGVSGMRIGTAEPECRRGGGGQILTLGSVSFPSKMTVYGGQILARGNVGFTANGTSVDEKVQGINIVAGGTINGTSNMTMSSCGGVGMDGNIMFPYARLVQ